MARPDTSVIGIDEVRAISSAATPLASTCQPHDTQAQLLLAGTTGVAVDVVGLTLCHVRRILRRRRRLTSLSTRPAPNTAMPTATKPPLSEPVSGRSPEPTCALS